MLYKDGIHDDTKGLQELLDNRGTVCVPSGTYLVTRPLIIHSNTFLSLAADAVIRLADGADCAILENESLSSRGEKHDENISVQGGIWDGNNPNQHRRSRESRFELTEYQSDYYYGIFMRFVGVKNFRLCSLTVKDPESYAALICAAENFTVENITFDYNLMRPNMDGIHVQGPARNGVIRDIKGTTNDDLVALNCDDVFASEITRGNIENILVDGLFSDNGYTAVRLLSCGSQMNNISIRNIFGSYNYYAVSFTHHKIHPGEPIWFNNILIDGVFASKPEGDTSVRPIIWFEEGIRAGKVSINNVFRTQKEKTNAPTLRLVGDVKIDSLSLSNIKEDISGRNSFIELDKSCINNLYLREVGINE